MVSDETVKLRANTIHIQILISQTQSYANIAYNRVLNR